LFLNSKHFHLQQLSVYQHRVIYRTNAGSSYTVQIKACLQQDRYKVCVAKELHSIQSQPECSQAFCNDVIEMLTTRNYVNGENVFSYSCSKKTGRLQVPGLGAINVENVSKQRLI